ncbi:MAG: DUF5103 domain-containing protein, partial [Tannerella sp.]|nr:DUF5103 domain-containing protein [Tannerella sp.]
SEGLKTLRVEVRGDEMSYPIIPIDGSKQIEISFDALGHDYERFTYTIEHCNADWRPSQLLPVEYLDGLQGLNIDNYSQSMTTATLYTHYSLLLPNADCKLKVSGNYAVHVFREGDPEDTLLTACFSVLEPGVNVMAGVTGNTLSDFNGAHQQVGFTLSANRLRIDYPQSDLKLFVTQNRRLDNAVTGLSPTRVGGGQLVYDPERSLIFTAGNEYRRFESLSHEYNGMGVDNIRFFNPYYHVTLLPEKPRTVYRYDQDQDGRFFVRCSSCNDPTVEADYDFVHFTLVTPELKGGSVYLLSDVLNNRLDNDSRMEYDPQRGAYVKHLLLKQGNYNYMYLFVPDGQRQGETAPLEGDFYETENEYAIYVYYHPFGARYDRFVGFGLVKAGVPR